MGRCSRAPPSSVQLYQARKHAPESNFDLGADASIVCSSSLENSFSSLLAVASAPDAVWPSACPGDRKLNWSDACDDADTIVPSERSPPTAASVSVDDVAVQAVQSLYNDRLKPYGRIIRKRVAELRTASGCSAAEADIDSSQLRAVCEASPLLAVGREDGGEWSALLVDRAACFIDIYSEVDTYPSELWERVAAYFAGLSDSSDATLPGGRYACAHTLASRNLSFLAGLKLGEICHIVQLALTARKILGYSGGAVVPYGQSQTAKKDQCARLQAAVEPSGPCGDRSEALQLHVADWPQALKVLREILEASAAPVPLSNIKRIFRSTYNMELSETALGAAKLSTLLEDERMQHVCSLTLQKSGYIVSLVPAIAQSVEQARPETQQFCVGEPLCLEDVSASEVAVSGWAAMSPSTYERDDGRIGGVQVRNTFIDVADGSSALRKRQASRRARSVPKNFCSNRNSWEDKCHELGFRTQPVTSVSEPTGSISSTPSTFPSTPEAEFCIPQPLPLMMPFMPQVIVYPTVYVVEPMRQVLKLDECM